MVNGSKLARLVPLTGVGFVVLLVVGAVVIDRYDYLPPPEELRTFYEDAPTRIAVGAYLVMVSALFLMWFAGSLRSALRVAEGGTGRLSAVAFGGAVAAGTLLIIAYAATQVAATRAGSASGVAPETAVALHDLQSVLAGNGAPIAFGVMVGASAVVWLRTRVRPAWFSWVSAVLAIGLASPLGWIFIAVAVLWVAVVGVVLYRGERIPAGVPAVS